MQLETDHRKIYRRIRCNALPWEYNRARMALTSRTKLGSYEILAPLGAGGMGEVFRARDTRLGRDVAIKVLSDAFSEDSDRLHRFEQEARATAALNHPNILAIFDIGSTDGHSYIVSELLEGETLRERLRSGPLPIRRTLEYALQVAHGLAAAHEKVIIHRDLKPENLFITKDGRVKILDFGLAKLTQAEPASSLPTQTAGTDPGMVLGTVGYMSPEQVRGVPVDARSDIFSFGAILYEMLSGKRAFHGETSADTMSAILKDDPPELTETNRNVSPALEKIVRHCLEKNPEARFHSASDLGFAIEAVSGTSTHTTPVQVGAAKSWRRMYTFLGAAALAIVMLGAGWFFGERSSQAPLPRYQRLTFRQGYIGNARFTPDGSVVYGASWDGEPNQLYITRPDNPGARELGIKDADVLSISKNGELAVRLKSLRLIGQEYDATLARVSVSGGTPREILDHVQDADWAPDGEQMAIIRHVPENDHWRLEYPVGKVLLESVTWISEPKISPDGRLVAFADHGNSEGDDQGSVAIIGSDGQKKILTGPWATLHGFVWSDTGSEVWFSATNNGIDGDLYAVTLNGHLRTVATAPGGMMIQDRRADLTLTITNRKRYIIRGLAPGAKEERNLGWFEFSILRDVSLDGKKILFEEEGEGGGPNYTVFIRDTDGSPPVRLGEGVAIGISPDGKWVATQPAKRGAISLVPTGTGESRQLTHDNVTYSLGQWTPDGKQLIATGIEPGHAARDYLIDVATGNSKAITPEGVRGLPLSPDGRSIAVRSPEGEWEIWPLATGAPRKIPGLNSRYLIFQWSPEGEYVYVLSGQASKPTPNLYRVNVVTGKMELWKTFLPTNPAGALGLRRCQFSKDGKAYAFSSHKPFLDRDGHCVREADCTSIAAQVEFANPH